MVTPGLRTGPLYVPRINEFAMTTWNVHEPSLNIDSLRRAVERIRDLPLSGEGQ